MKFWARLILVCCLSGSFVGCVTSVSDSTDTPFQAAEVVFGEDPVAYLDALGWPPIFGTYRVQGRYAGYSAFEAAFVAFEGERGAYASCDRLLRGDLEDGSCSSHGLADWRRLVAIDGLRADPVGDGALQFINDRLNRFRVIAPRSSPDVWQTPLDFFSDGSAGTDVTFTKYVTLRELGVAAKDLMIAVGRRRGTTTWHSMLLVRRWLPAGDETVLILDSVDPVVRPTHQRADYDPWHLVMEGGAFAVRHLIGGSCGAKMEHAAQELGLACDETVGPLGAYTLPCDTRCPGDPRTVCVDLGSPSVQGAPGLCVHTPVSGCEQGHEYRVVRRRFDGERATICAPVGWSFGTINI